MGIHQELAELVASVGRDVLDDASEFRAAFDDFVSEGAATEGDINLLTDAVRLGALRRVVDQIDNGAEPRRAVEAQATRLAAQRGTQESVGAQWALTVLAFALGAIEESAVTAFARGRPAPLPPTALPRLAPAPDVPPAPPAAVPPVSPPTLPPPITTPFATSPAAPTIAPPRSRPRAAPSLTERRRRRKRGLLAAVIAIVLLCAAAGVHAVVRTDRDAVDAPAAEGSDAGTDTDDDQADPEVVRLDPGTLLASAKASPPAAEAPAVIGGRRSGVRVVAWGVIPALDEGTSTTRAASGEELVAFTLADGPCQARECDSWEEGELAVVTDGRPEALPKGGPTFVVSVPVGDAVQLSHVADGIDQRVSLRDGSPGGDHIAVLARERRAARVDRRVVVRPTSTVFEPETRTVTVGSARLFFFNGPKGLANPDSAYLVVDVTYTRPGISGRRAFYFSEIHLEGPDGKEYPKRDLDPSTPKSVKPDLAFIVLGTFTRGTLVLRGTRTATDATSGRSGPLTIPETPVELAIPLR